MSDQIIDSILGHLGELICADTQNPPRAIDADHPVFQYIRGQLADFDIQTFDHDHGRVSFYARRGTPSVLFNVHLDTVPVGPNGSPEGWTVDPLKLTVKDGRAYGRGSCDIKGAAACLMHIAQTCDAPMALLFTTDEEGASGCCVHRFVAQPPDPYAFTVVAEPTQCKAITGHRGYLSVITEFSGRAGHSSEARALQDNAIHRFSAWAAKATAQAGSMVPHPCFNIGRVDGGSKSNVIADSVQVRWSARLPSGASNDDYLASIKSLDASASATWKVPFSGPPLPDGTMDMATSHRFIETHELESGAPVDFWTEASLFSAGGIPAIVLGPGNIEQAHTVDEWVALDQLEYAESIYRTIILNEAGS